MGKTILYILALLAILLVHSGCDSPASEPSGPAKPQSSGLEQARACLVQGQLVASRQIYTRLAQHLPTQAVAAKGEAYLGILLVDLLTVQPGWQQSYQQWSSTGEYYWQGSTRSFDEQLAPGYRHYLLQATAQKPELRKVLALLRMLLEHGYYQVASRLWSEHWQQVSLVQELILGMVWQALRQGDVARANQLLQVPGPATVGPQQEQRQSACLLVALLSKSPPQLCLQHLPTAWGQGRYSIERDRRTLFRPEGPFGDLPADIRRTLTARQALFLLACDLLYGFSLRQPHAEELIAQASDWITANEQLLPASAWARHIIAQQKGLWVLRQGWEKFRQGELPQAAKLFGRYQQSKLAELQTEARLGLALVAWKQNSLRTYRSWLPSQGTGRYHLLGGTYDFRQGVQGQAKILARLLRQAEHYQNLLLFDALLRLGERRSANRLVALLCSRYRQQRQVRDFYLKAQQRIPRELYVEGSVWEKIE